MPTFDFKCTSCEKTFEGTISFGSKKKPVCPSCKSKKTEKLLSPPLGIVFKGSGFYKTDSTARKDVKDKSEIKDIKEAPKVDSPKPSNTTKNT